MDADPYMSITQVKIFYRFVMGTDDFDAAIKELEELFRDGWTLGGGEVQVLPYGSLQFLIFAALNKFPKIPFQDRSSGPVQETLQPLSPLTPEEIKALYAPPASEAPDDKDLGEEGDEGEQ